MSYLGNAPESVFTEMKYQDLTGGSGTSFTLNQAVSNPQEIEVFVNNVRQEPSAAYSVSGTTLTMTESVGASEDFYVVFQGMAQGSATHPATQSLEAASVTSTGAISGTTITGTGLITASAGVAIGGTGAANTLDDYEEGTFTPTVSASITSPAYTSQVGSYTKVGRLVAFSLYLKLSSGTPNSDQITIAGLPFTSLNTTYVIGGVHLFDEGTSSALAFLHTLQGKWWIDPNANSIKRYNIFGAAAAGNGANGWNEAVQCFYLTGQYFAS